ncbi:MAG: hypothetical protein KJO82_02725, partial [Gammaproteobacteria bacterium]|nr:hypothetical protein [Gammaproteobacteria bacterium]
MSATAPAKPEDTQAYLPDFCAAGTIFIVVLVGELIAIMLTVASNAPGLFFVDLYKSSFFVLWFALLGCALMCQLTDWLENLGPTRAFVTGFFVLLSLCAALAEI